MATRMLEYFGTLVAEDVGFPLTEAALALAQDAYPDLDLQAVLAEIDELAMRVRKRLPRDAGAVQKLQLLNRFFFGELGFACNLNDYYDPDNSHLNAVLHKRRGIPITLAVLYLEISEQLGRAGARRLVPRSFPAARDDAPRAKSCSTRPRARPCPRRGSSTCSNPMCASMRATRLRPCCARC